MTDIPVALLRQTLRPCQCHRPGCRGLASYPVLVAPTREEARQVAEVMFATLRRRTLHPDQHRLESTTGRSITLDVN